MADPYRVKRIWEKWLLGLRGVVGVGVRGGKLVVYVKSYRDAYLIPRTLDGVEVEVVVVGEPRAWG